MPDTLEKVYNSALKFLAPLNIEKTYEEIVSEAVKLTDTHWGTIYLKQGDELVRTYTTVPQKHSATPRKDGYTHKAFTTGRAFLLTNLETKKTHPMHDKAKFIIHIPLHYNKKPYGVLNLISKKELKKPYAGTHELKLFGTMASLAIRKAQLHSEKQDALARRDLFLNIASHELKTPLTSIYVYAELLKRKFGDTETPEGKWSKRLYRETIRLANLVSELLSVDLAKTGSLSYFMNSCSLKKIAERAINDTQLVYPEHDLLLRIAEPDASYYVNGDYEKLLQVTINILSNACKFSPIGSLVTLSLEKKANQIILAVQDYGKGIPKESLKRIFDIFYKGDSSQEGMGIGLYLVKKIIEKHNASIKISSKENKGTKVEIVFMEAKNVKRKRKLPRRT